MIQIGVKNDFADWRNKARKLLPRGIAPEEILWTNCADSGEQSVLFKNDLIEENTGVIFKIPADFFPLAEAVACSDAPQKWSLLYRLLFRLVYENRNLLHIESDTDVRTARLLEKSVSRDVHKFHAFVRFRRVEFERREIFVAWYEPQHYTVERATPFFVRRFGAMRFSILTPKGCAHWDLENLTFSGAVGGELAPPADDAGECWLAYYQSIFNPFRLKVKAMKAELPVRHWRTLPEAALIPEMIRRAKNLKK